MCEGLMPLTKSSCPPNYEYDAEPVDKIYLINVEKHRNVEISQLTQARPTQAVTKQCHETPGCLLKAATNIKKPC